MTKNELLETLREKELASIDDPEKCIDYAMEYIDRVLMVAYERMSQKELRNILEKMNNEQ